MKFVGKIQSKNIVIARLTAVFYKMNVETQKIGGNRISVDDTLHFFTVLYVCHDRWAKPTLDSIRVGFIDRPLVYPQFGYLVQNHRTVSEGLFLCYYFPYVRALD